jgi:hypothetical protein
MRVYHLLPSRYVETSIRDRRLKIARIQELNDPFELLAGNLRSRADRQAARKWKDVYSRAYGLLCFSPHWHSPVMWSHYADRHRGVCFGFDIIDSQAVRVEYNNHRIPVAYKAGNSANGLDTDFANRVLSTKFEHWRYEEEIRMFVPLDPSFQAGDLYFRPFSDTLKLREIGLGPLCALQTTDIRDLVASMEPEVKVFRTRLAFQTFTIVRDRRVGA